MGLAMIGRSSAEDWLKQFVCFKCQRSCAAGRRLESLDCHGPAPPAVVGCGAGEDWVRLVSYAAAAFCLLSQAWKASHLAWVGSSYLASSGLSSM